MNLNVRWVSEVSTLAVALDSCCTVTTHSVGREEVSVAINTGNDKYGVGRETLQLTWVNVGNLLIHIEEVSLTLKDNVDTEAVNRLREVEEYGKASVVDTEALVATLLGSA